MRMRSPRTAPPVNGLVGSTATTPTRRPSRRIVPTSAAISVLLPAPGGPVTPTTYARPVWGCSSRSTATASAGRFSTSEISLATAWGEPWSTSLASVTGLNHDRWAIRPERPPQRVADLAHRRVGAHSLQDRRQEVCPSPCLPTQRRQGGIDARPVPLRPNAPQPGLLPVDDRRIHTEDLGRSLFSGLEAIDAHDDAVSGLDVLLVSVRRLADLPLHVSRLDRPEHAADLADAVEIRHRPPLDLGREGLHIIGTGQRVDRIGHPTLVADDLLRAQGEQRRLVRRQRERLVPGVRVERLGAAEDGRQRLDRDAHDVVVGLLRGQRDPRGLRMEPEHPRSRVPGAELFPRDPGPQPARGPELRDLLEEPHLRVEEEREPRRDVIDAESGGPRGLEVCDRVPERERDFLDRGGARLPDVVAADADRVPSGSRSAQNAIASVTRRSDGPGG